MLWKSINKGIKVYRIPHGIANTMWCLSPRSGGGLFFGQVRRHLGKIFHALAQQKECQILEGHLLPDQVHMCIGISPKHPVASVIGFLKGKNAIAVAREFCGKDRNFTGEHFPF
jgi:putative transposase